MKVKKVKYSLTKRMRRALNKLACMEENLPSVMKQSVFQKKVSIEEKTLYLEKLAEYRTNFWDLVYKAYPELYGRALKAYLEVVTPINHDQN